VFVQKLSNIFGFYIPEDDDKDAIATIPFPPNSKAMTYFIQFTKYQNRIHWGDHSLWKVIKDAISSRINKELHYSKKDLSTFEGLKRAVLKINSNYWRRLLDNKQRQQTAHTLQNHTPRDPKPEQSSSIISIDRANIYSITSTKWYQSPQTQIKPSHNPALTSILGSNRKLTPLERQCRMDLGLCICYDNLV